MVKRGAAYQEAQGDLSNLPSCLGCTVCAHSPGRAWPWLQSVPGARGKAKLVLIVEARSATRRSQDPKSTAHTTGTFPAPALSSPGQALQENTWLCTQKGVRGPRAWSACQGPSTGSP